MLDNTFNNLGKSGFKIEGRSKEKSPKKKLEIEQEIMEDSFFEDLENIDYKHVEDIWDFIAKKDNVVVRDLLDELFKDHKTTYEHSIRVTQLALDIASKIGLSEKDIKLLMVAGLFHDWGKTKMNKKILDGPKLSKDNDFWKEIKKHPKNSVTSIEKIFEVGLISDEIDKKIIESVIELHHGFKKENPYPFSLKDKEKFKEYIKEKRLSDKEGKKILELIEILTICDIWESMTSKKRLYREASTEEAKAKKKK